MPRNHLSVSEARRVAITAQGLQRPPSPSQRSVTARKIGTAVQQLGIVQIDSVNVLACAHLLTLYTRLDAYDPEVLHRAAYDVLGKRPPRKRTARNGERDVRLFRAEFCHHRR